MLKNKKFKLLNSASALLLISSVSLFLFTGCQSKSTENDANQAVAANSSATANQSSNGRPNSDEMKKRMVDNISLLVSDGTINQSQGDKILEALTTNTQRFNGEKRTQNNQQNNKNNEPKDPNSNAQGNKQNDPNNNNQGNRKNRPQNNELSKLVSDGVITQTQADAVMQKIRGTFKPTQSN